MIWFAGLVAWIGFGLLFAHCVGRAIGQRRGDDVPPVLPLPCPAVMRIPFAGVGQ